jgi:hypothetical protein
MKRPAAALAAALALTLALPAPARAASGSTSSTSTAADAAEVAAAAKALTEGAHVYVAAGGPKIHVADLKTLIGTNKIYVVAVRSSPAHANDWIALLSTATRINGTYVVLNNDVLSASSNTFPMAGVEAARQAAVSANPTDPIAAVDDFVRRLLAGDADVTAGQPTPGAGPAATTTAGAKSSGTSPVLLLLLLPILGGVAYAVTRARRRTG